MLHLLWIAVLTNAFLADSDNPFDAPAKPPAGRTRTWTDRQGRTVEAGLVSVKDEPDKGQKVVIRREGDGKEWELPMGRLSDDDQEFVKLSAILQGPWRAAVVEREQAEGPMKQEKPDPSKTKSLDAELGQLAKAGISITISHEAIKIDRVEGSIGSRGFTLTFKPIAEIPYSIAPRTRKITLGSPTEEPAQRGSAEVLIRDDKLILTLTVPEAGLTNAEFTRETPKWLRPVANVKKNP